MITHSDADLQHMVSEMLNDNADIQTIAIMLREDRRIIAAQTAAKIKFSATLEKNKY